MKVAKFGGTSLATAEQIRKVYDIIRSDPARKIIVVSAPGKRFDGDIKVTDMLIAYAEKYLTFGSAEQELNSILARYIEIAQELALSDEVINNLTKGIIDHLTSSITDRNAFMDTVKATGEKFSAKLVAYYLQSREFDAIYVDPNDAGLVVSNKFGNAYVLEESYQNLNKLKNTSKVIIFPGFFGYSTDGTIVTFPRGGSDITGAILAAAVNAEYYENFTDVDSVFAVNPQIVPNPQGINELTYREMRELAYAGFTVLNDEALMPAYRANVPVNVKNTNNPSAPGTRIVISRDATDRPIIGIASDSGFCSIYVSKYLMNREIGFGRKLLEILEDEGLSYEHIPSGIDNISVILRGNQLNPEIEKRVINRIKEQLNVEDVVIERNLALIMIVGEGMRSTVGIASRATEALAKASVNIEMINQGSSKVSMMFGIKAIDEEKAIKALYFEFFGND
ncbi:aspartate kinase [Vulcanibacillus modesticaldus]|uniref:Aspartokinase n=1 Tax=Vulcanibacillus modesticaldus TaxID=337097 RepID=A0A1D2YWM5_9BACI|nr:aspartate kinase [Vulcanibacillus modesticaldus]OEG00165.1 aspartate kinase [Vulcanibacillus modesticaldus]